MEMPSRDVANHLIQSLTRLKTSPRVEAQDLHIYHIPLSISSNRLSSLANSSSILSFASKMMDPLSISAAVVSLVVTAARVAREAEQFRSQVREARREMDSVARELLSVKSALSMLADDLKSPSVIVPVTLQDIIDECETVINTLDQTLKKYNQERLSARVRYVWTGRDTMNSYKSTLAAHRGALDLAIDIMTLSLNREIKIGVDETRMTTQEIKADTENILAQIALLQARLPEQTGTRIDVQPLDSTFMIRRYLEELTEYASTVIGSDDEDARSDGPITRTSHAIRSQKGEGYGTPFDTFDTENLRFIDGKQADASLDESESTQDVLGRLKDLAIDSEGRSNRDDFSVATHPVRQQRSDFPNTTDVKIYPAMGAAQSQQRAPVPHTDAIRQHHRMDVTTPNTLRNSTDPPPGRSTQLDNSVEDGVRAIANGYGRPQPPVINAPQSLEISLLAQEFNSTLSLDIPAKYLTKGFESAEHRTWRTAVFYAMNKIPEHEIQPRNGETYELNVDYNLHISAETDENIIVPLLPRGLDVKSDARLVKWIRRFTLSQHHINGVVCLAGHNTHKVTASPEQSTSAICCPPPIALALEMQDWDWLNQLHLVWIPRPNFHREFVRLGPPGRARIAHGIWDGNILAAWFFIEQLRKTHQGEDIYARCVMLSQLIDMRWDHAPNILPHSAAISEGDTFRLHFARLLLKIDPSIPVCRDLLEFSIKASSILMLQLFLELGADLNSDAGDDGIGTVLHFAVFCERWWAVKMLVDAGADPSKSCKINNKLANVDGRHSFVTPIGLAANRGVLDKLNEALGTEYEDDRPVPTKFKHRFLRFSVDKW